MEPIGNDESFGEVGSGNGAIGLRQVHADDADTVFAFHLIEIIGQRWCRAAGSNVEDTAAVQRQPPWPVGLTGRRACPSEGQFHRPIAFQDVGCRPIQGVQNTDLCFNGGSCCPSGPITDQQVTMYMTERPKYTQRTATARAGFSERTARRLDANPVLPSQRQRKRGRTVADPLEGVWDKDLLPILQRDASVQAVTLLRHLQHSYPD